MQEVVIVGACRTPIGDFGGKLAGVAAAELASIVIKEVIHRAAIEPGMVDEVIFGQCLQRTDEPNIGRTGALKAGLPKEVSGFTVQRQCASAMQALVSAFQEIALARIVNYAWAGVEPDLMGYGPVPATKKALAKAGWSLGDIQLIELNEAFAAQYLTCEKLLEFNREIVNVNGSGVGLGHPVGSTGARLIVTLLHEMIRRNLKKGLASLCVGGGMGMTLLIER